LTIVPDSMPWPSRGSFTSVATVTRLPHRAVDGLQDVVGVRDDELLHHRRERNRRELRPHALDRRVEPVERLVLQHRRDLGAEAHPRHRLVRDDGAVRLLHRRDQGLLVERLQRARVDDLHGDPPSPRPRPPSATRGRAVRSRSPSHPRPRGDVRAFPSGIGSICSGTLPLMPYSVRCSKKTTGLSS
jgi:hypothetical protein